ncbi:hypothetical protein HMPREF0497_1450, partial [Lentilactobacillus buchneri ATCC 11577]
FKKIGLTTHKVPGLFLHIDNSEAKAEQLRIVWQINSEIKVVYTLKINYLTFVFRLFVFLFF